MCHFHEFETKPGKENHKNEIKDLSTAAEFIKHRIQRAQASVSHRCRLILAYFMSFRIFQITTLQVVVYMYV